MSDSSPELTTSRSGKPMAFLAILCGLGFALVMAWQMSPRPSDSPVVLTYDQPSRFGGRSAGVTFDLPPGWRIVYNGHQPWHGGTVVDAAGRPRMEVWLHRAPNRKPTPDEEEVTFLWGKARCTTQTLDMDRPFNSFPQVRVGRIVVRHFYLDDGFLNFQVPATEEDDLKPIIRTCMDSLRRQPGD